MNWQARAYNLMCFLLIPHIEAPHSLSSLLSDKVLSKLYLGKLDIAFGTLVNYAY